MTYSMTAFARFQVQGEWGVLTWEIRSVNHRYLEPHFRLPDPLREVEPLARDILRKQLSRGKVECTLKLRLEEAGQSLSVNYDVLKKLKDALGEVASIIHDSQPAKVTDLLKWPGVQETEEKNIAPVCDAAVQGFTQALTQLNAMRAREGEELGRFILTRLADVEKEVRLIRASLPEILMLQRQKLLNRLKEAQQELDSNRLEQEMVILAQKLDVEEELDRITIHTGEVERVLSSGQKAVGRRLDFLMQELNREANTLSSKSITAELTQAAVNIKVLVEQMREQVQNIQ